MVADLWVHLVCATERTLCCILENYQTPDGFNVPEVLRKYIPGIPERPKQAAVA
jgi:seryl-tRNA synthetase